jgi:hypothetical protein
LLDKATNQNQPLFETTEESSLLSWRPLHLQTFLEQREGQIWRHEDTLELIRRAEEIDTFIEQLIRRAGLSIKNECPS